MPNFDGGHYFLTCLAPVVTLPGDPLRPATTGERRERRALAQTLAMLPTGQQTDGSPPDAPPSPFARNTLNHFARFAVIDQPTFNGRVSGDSLVALVRKTDPLVPQKVDRLASPFLLFAADIDAPGDPETALRAYTAELWRTMRAELEDIFGHCAGFAGTDTAEKFHGYIKRCQVETTMPFNDYWLDGLKVTPGQPVSNVALALAAVVAIAALVLWHWAAVPWLLLGAVIGVYLIWRSIIARGQQPFPSAPGGDLPSVLKSLYLQQQFTRFAIEAQGLDDAALYARFAAFAGATQPDFSTPAQPAGAVRSDDTEWAR